MVEETADKRYLYTFDIHFVLELTTPPDDPGLKQHLLENVVDYLGLDGQDPDFLIKNLELIAEREL